MSNAPKTKMPSRPEYHFKFMAQKTMPHREQRWLLYRANNEAVDLEDDDADYETINMSASSVKRLLAATLETYGATVDIETFDPQKFLDRATAANAHAQVAHAAMEDVEHVKKQYEQLEAEYRQTLIRLTAVQNELIEARGTINALRLNNDAPVQSVNGKVGHVAMTKHDFAEMDPPSFDLWLRASGIEPSAFKEAMQRIEAEFSEPDNDFAAKIGKHQPQDDALVFDETDAPAEKTEAEQPRHEVFMHNFELHRPPSGTSVRRFAAMSIGMLAWSEDNGKTFQEEALFADIAIDCRQPDDTYSTGMIRLLNPDADSRARHFIREGIAYETRVSVMKEVDNV